jgi:hypothetical protein
MEVGSTKGGRGGKYESVEVGKEERDVKVGEEERGVEVGKEEEGVEVEVEEKKGVEKWGRRSRRV